MFYLVALDEHDKVVIRKKFSRKQLLAYTENQRKLSCFGFEISLAQNSPVAPRGTSGVRRQRNWDQ